ncbi:(2Fe-2S)-binding protein [Bosea sp. (in: a-proteobacteria)]|uniref:(2Fe-2S)-binding protein n=1 Tax=Bosea sp. (in: a-proteobacteria) TaxID=1871050 RepID=UPI0031FF32B6
MSFRFDGEALTAREGETLATALYAQGRRTLRISRDDGGPRGAFCFMGVCQECVVAIDGRLTEACRTPVREGLVVESVR